MSSDGNEKSAVNPSVDYTGWTTNACVQNLWTTDLQAVTLRHIFGNNPANTQLFTWNNVAVGDTTTADLEVTYFTGFFSSHDYWYVSFQLTSGQVYQSKANFYCDLESGDAGSVVTATINSQGATLTITPPQSSSCSTASITETS